MAPVVALPVGELKEGQIYHLVDGRLVVSPAEKQKRKRLAAKAISVAEASNVTEDAKVVLTIKVPPKSTGGHPQGPEALHGWEAEAVKGWARAQS
jgi:hypothetical protein